MKKSLLILALPLLISPLVSATAEADNRGSLTISATFGNIGLHSPQVVYVPEVHYRPAPTVVVVNETRQEKKWRHGHKHRHDDRFDCDSRDYRRSGHRQRGPSVVYYYPDYREPRGYYRY